MQALFFYHSHRPQLPEKMYLKLANLGMIQKTYVLVFLLLLLNFGTEGANLVQRLPGFPGELPFKLETGYVGVGEKEKVQLYYYFVESQRDPLSDPLIFWHTGGPGCSALSSMLYEIGPIQFDYKAFYGALPTLLTNPDTLTKVANMVFIDAPVGTGFSYSESNKNYYIMDDIDAAEANYQFLLKWLLEHPKFQNNSVYVGGSSYAGKIVPILVDKIHTGQMTKQVPKINLKGYILGNPDTNRAMSDNMRIQYANRFGLISDELYESFKINCGNEYLYPDIQNALCLKAQQAIDECMKVILMQHILDPTCNFARDYASTDDIVQALHGKKQWCRRVFYKLSEIWADDPGVREALYVRKGTKGLSQRCNETISENYPTTIVASVVDYHKSIANYGYRAIIYSGDHDMLISYISTLKWISLLNLTVSDPWRPWIVAYEAAGYTRTYIYEDSYELTFATVKGGGHIAQEHHPKRCFEMLDRWLAHSKL